MAWIFGLSAECGINESDAHGFAQHFDDVSWVLSSGRECVCRPDTFQDSEENWWCRVVPSNLSEVGIDSAESAYVMTELGILLYQALRFAPAFRYALVGVEVDEFRTYSELIEESSSLLIPGLVLSRSIEQQLELLPVFRSFSLNAVWQPYAGEIYNPLMVSPNLKSKLNKLLAAS
jgi:hypothetical protein